MAFIRMAPNFPLLCFGLTILMASCRRDQLKLADLRWGDNYRDQIAANHIDTAYLISKNKILKLGGSDTVGIMVFDSVGNTLYDKRREYWGSTTYYRYDSNHLVSYKNYVTDFEDDYDISYKFFPDSMVVYQDWTDHGSHEPSLGQFWVYRFNKSGLLTESNNELGTGGKSFYKYNSKGLLVTEYQD